MQRPAARGIDLWHTAIPVALVTLTGAHPHVSRLGVCVTGVLESVHCDPLSHASHFIERLPYGFSCKLVSRGARARGAARGARARRGAGRRGAARR